MTVGAGSTFFYEIQKFFLRKSMFLDPRFKRSKKKKKKKKAGLASAARAFAKSQSALEEILKKTKKIDFPGLLWAKKSKGPSANSRKP